MLDLIINRTNITHTFTPFFRYAQKFDNKYLSSIAASSLAMGVAATFFGQIQNPGLLTIASPLSNRNLYFAIAGISFTIMALSRLPRMQLFTFEQMEELHIIHILTDPKSSAESKKAQAQKIADNPGNFSPFILIYAGIYFLEQKNYQQAAILCAGGQLRSEIDLKTRSMETEEGVLVLANMKIGNAVDKHLQTAEEINAWGIANNAAFKNFIEWDQNTPRKYNETWMNPRSKGILTGNEIIYVTSKKNQKDQIIRDYYGRHKKILSQHEWGKNTQSSSDSDD